VEETRRLCRSPAAWARQKGAYLILKVCPGKSAERKIP